MSEVKEKPYRWHLSSRMLADEMHLKKFIPLPTSAGIPIHKGTRKNLGKYFFHPLLTFKC